MLQAGSFLKKRSKDGARAIDASTTQCPRWSNFRFGELGVRLAVTVGLGQLVVFPLKSFIHNLLGSRLK
jgi:hypothetical protein